MISLPPGTEHLPLDVREGIQCLFVLLRSHSDPRRALDAALKAVVNLGVTAPSTHEHVVSRPDSAGPGPADPARYVEETPVAGATKVGEDGNPASPPLPYSLDCYPKCKSLIEHYNLAAPAKKKNPLLILNEYANKLNLEITFEPKESTLPGCCIEARLTSAGGDILYGRGIGQGRGKKDARQLAGAAVLEIVLESVPQSDFISSKGRKGKAKDAKGAAADSGAAANGVEEMQDVVHDAGGMDIEPNAGEGDHPEAAEAAGGLTGFVKQSEPDAWSNAKRDVDTAQQTDEGGSTEGAGQAPVSAKKVKV